MTSSSLDDVHAKLSTVRTTLGTVHATLDSVTATLSTVTAALDTVTSTTQDNVAALDTMQTTVSTITTTLDTLKVTVATLQTELDSYSGGFNQPAQDSLNFPPAPTIDSSYNKVQVQQLANNVVVLANKIDSLLVVLRNAKIISV
jgi:ABC-type transporter Mla subunit MlaD